MDKPLQWVIIIGIVALLILWKVKVTVLIGTLVLSFFRSNWIINICIINSSKQKTVKTNQRNSLL